jgi:hypothetical protein
MNPFNINLIVERILFFVDDKSRENIIYLCKSVYKVYKERYENEVVYKKYKWSVHTSISLCEKAIENEKWELAKWIIEEVLVKDIEYRNRLLLIVGQIRSKTSNFDAWLIEVVGKLDFSDYRGFNEDEYFWLLPRRMLVGINKAYEWLDLMGKLPKDDLFYWARQGDYEGFTGIIGKLLYMKDDVLWSIMCIIIGGNYRIFHDHICWILEGYKKNGYMVSASIERFILYTIFTFGSVDFIEKFMEYTRDNEKWGYPKCKYYIINGLALVWYKELAMRVIMTRNDKNIIKIIKKYDAFDEEIYQLYEGGRIGYNMERRLKRTDTEMLHEPYLVSCMITKAINDRKYWHIENYREILGPIWSHIMILNEAIYGGNWKILGEYGTRVECAFKSEYHYDKRKIWDGLPAFNEHADWELVNFMRYLIDLVANLGNTTKVPKSYKKMKAKYMKRCAK